MRFDVTPQTPLAGGYDLAQVLRTMPDGQLVKGLFFGRHVARLGREWPRVQATLEAPPRLGRYLPFSDYPVRDYSRVVHEVSLVSYPGAARYESLRQTARDDQGEFSSSTLGAVMRAMVHDAHGMLMAYPNGYSRCVIGQSCRAESLPGRGVRLVYAGVFGIGAYTVGQVEGMVLAHQDHWHLSGEHDPKKGDMVLEVEL